VIAAVATVRNEVDIIGTTVTHLLDQGVDLVLVYDGMSTDGTRDVLDAFDGRVLMFDDPADHHRQPMLISRLARLAGASGASWVIPFDADEFWVTCAGDTIADALNALPDTARKLYARMYQHHGLDRREADPKPWPKVAFRPTLDVEVANGNHEVNIDGGIWGVLEVREVQYRSFEQFVRKIAERNETIDPSLPAGEGAHHKRFAGWTVEQLEPVWAEMQARPTILDPIPTKVNR
jgi:glycosyltransferase involved in cell wall biosynthesis